MTLIISADMEVTFDHLWEDTEYCSERTSVATTPLNECNMLTSIHTERNDICEWLAKNNN